MLHSGYVFINSHTNNFLNYISVSGFDRSKNFALLEKYLAERSKILCFVKKGPEVDTRLIHIPLLDKILNKEIV